MNTTDFHSIRKFIYDTLQAVTPFMDKDSIDGVKHYLNHSEYEMAFEGLFISIMELPIKPEIDIDRSFEVALELNLNEESVFDFDFWTKFNTFKNKFQ